MSGSELSQLLENLTRLAFLFGPSFFAVLFVVFITRLAKSDYNKICTRTSPKASEQEIKTYRNYFKCSSYFGLLLVALSVGWWFYYQSQGSYTYQIAITNLASNVKVDSRYFSKETKRVSRIPDLDISDAYFLVVQDRPFRDGERFPFTIVVLPAQPSFDTGGGVQLSGRRIEVHVPYNGERKVAYSLDIPEQGEPKLVPLGSDQMSETAFLSDLDILVASAFPHLNGAER